MQKKHRSELAKLYTYANTTRFPEQQKYKLGSARFPQPAACRDETDGRQRRRSRRSAQERAFCSKLAHQVLQHFTICSGAALLQLAVWD